jgi:hypothetical protein
MRCKRSVWWSDRSQRHSQERRKQRFKVQSNLNLATHAQELTSKSRPGGETELRPFPLSASELLPNWPSLHNVRVCEISELEKGVFLSITLYSLSITRCSAT